MSKHLIWHADEILNYGVGNFESRLLLDSKMAGEPCINVNHITVKPGISTAKVDAQGNTTGPAHEKAEIYLCISGKGELWRDGEISEMRQGSLAYIPGGTAHYITNLSDTTPLCFLTLWSDEQDNDVWHKRKAAWGEGYERRKMPK